MLLQNTHSGAHSYEVVQEGRIQTDVRRFLCLPRLAGAPHADLASFVLVFTHSGEQEAPVCLTLNHHYEPFFYLLFKVDVFDHSGVGVVHPDTPNVCGGQNEIHQSLLRGDDHIDFTVDRLKMDVTE